MYGLPKIHKNESDPDYRPILSMRNSAKYNLSKWLDSFLKPHIPKEFTLKDTFEFVNSLNNFKRNCPKNSCFVSFDAISLFSNIPVSSTIEHIISSIDDNLLPVEMNTLRQLLTLACKNVLFSFDSELYIQQEGMAMRSPLGPTMAAFAMDKIERKICAYAGQKSLFYKRYVDDIFAIL